MDEFSLIQTYFQGLSCRRADVVLGIGDDAACLEVPLGHQLLVSSDTLVADVHFCADWDAYDIAYRAVMVNVSDIAAMAGNPCWLTLALTLPSLDNLWLTRFSKGLSDAMQLFNLELIGGDTTRGPLSLTLTIHGTVPRDSAIRRCGARPHDKIYISGDIGAAAFAVELLDKCDYSDVEKAVLMKKLLHPKPRVDLTPILRRYASAAIDISDGLNADLNHICVASQVAACLFLERIPMHPLVKKYKADKALDFVLSGGDDYELCFTVSPSNEPLFLNAIAEGGLHCHCVGVIESGCGLRGQLATGESYALPVLGYRHF